MKAIRLPKVILTTGVDSDTVQLLEFESYTET